jgi:hypothetical protein
MSNRTAISKTIIAALTNAAEWVGFASRVIGK